MALAVARPGGRTVRSSSPPAIPLPVCSGSKLTVGRPPCSRGPTTRRVKPITCFRNCCRVAGPYSSPLRPSPAALMPHKWPFWISRRGRARSSCAAAVTLATWPAGLARRRGSARRRPSRLCGVGHVAGGRVRRDTSGDSRHSRAGHTWRGKESHRHPACCRGWRRYARLCARGFVGDLAPRTLVWVDRQGRETPISAQPAVGMSIHGCHRTARASRSSPPIRKVDVWIWNFNRTTLTRATLDAGIDHSSTVDARRRRADLQFRARRHTESLQATGRRHGRRRAPHPECQPPECVGCVIRWALVVFTETAPKTGDDVMQFELGGNHRVTPLIQSVFAERNGVISPDGRWLAYESNASGRFEVWVRPFPDVTSGQSQVSTAGGTRPRWTRSGQELVYVSPTGALMRVGVARGASWSTTPPTLLIKEGYSPLHNSISASRTTSPLMASGFS